MSRVIGGSLALAAAIVIGAGPLGAQQTPFVADSGPSRQLEAPNDPRSFAAKFWLDEAWWDEGRIAAPVTYKVKKREISYRNPSDGTDVPALVVAPDAPGRFPAVMFLHGRRGLDDLVERLAVRAAARGFVVLAPNAYAARFIAAMPVEHLAATEADFGAGLAVLLALPEVSTSRACLLSHTRGGYVSLRLATTRPDLADRIACLVTYYPHWQNPAAPEADQVYRHAGEIDRLAVPVLAFIGEFEQYQRRRSIESAMAALKSAGREARLIVYPGVGRGFDFRPTDVRTFADDLAAKDAVQRAAEFMLQKLTPWVRK